MKRALYLAAMLALLTLLVATPVMAQATDQYAAAAQYGAAEAQYGAGVLPPTGGLGLLSDCRGRASTPHSTAPPTLKLLLYL